MADIYVCSHGQTKPCDECEKHRAAVATPPVDAEAVAKEIADYLFTNGFGDKGDHLNLYHDGDVYLGGWNEDSVVKAIVTFLTYDEQDGPTPSLPSAPLENAPRSNLEPHAYQEHPLYPNYCAFAVGKEDYCKREPDNFIHQFTTPLPSAVAPTGDEQENQ